MNALMIVGERSGHAKKLHSAARRLGLQYEFVHSPANPILFGPPKMKKVARASSLCAVYAI
jgi:hypothetical protein